MEGQELIVFESKMSKLRVGGFYKPFTYPGCQCPKAMEAELLELISNASNNTYEYIAGGDMNIDMLKKDAKS